MVWSFMQSDPMASSFSNIQVLTEPLHGTDDGAVSQRIKGQQSSYFTSWHGATPLKILTIGLISSDLLEFIHYQCNNNRTVIQSVILRQRFFDSCYYWCNYKVSRRPFIWFEEHRKPHISSVMNATTAGSRRTWTHTAHTGWPECRRFIAINHSVPRGMIKKELNYAFVRTSTACMHHVNNYAWMLGIVIKPTYYYYNIFIIIIVTLHQLQRLSADVL